MPNKIIHELEKSISSLRSVTAQLIRTVVLLLESEEFDTENIDDYSGLSDIVISLAKQNKLKEAEDMLIVKHGLNTLKATEKDDYEAIKKDLLAILA